MKILVIQLARIGDVLLTAPVLQGLKSKYGEASIHLLVRQSFRSAAEVQPHYDRLWVFDSKEVLSSVSETELASACDYLDNQIIEPLLREDFDLIINLSFSPASSYLTSILDPQVHRTRGYTRHKDGYLQLPDDGSAYFYAQVGPEQNNRFHLLKVFCFVANIDYPYGFFKALQPREKKAQICVQIGASESHKRLIASQWSVVLEALLQVYSGEVVLIGSPEEVLEASQIQKEIQSPRLRNAVGRMALGESIAEIYQSERFIGCDSMGVHVASLFSVPSFQISMGRVRFWETGPLSVDSRVFEMKQFGELALHKLSIEIQHWTQNKSPETAMVFPKSDEETTKSGEDLFSWQLIRSLYVGDDFPVPKQFNIYRAFYQGLAAADFGLQQLANLHDDSISSTSVEFLEQIDMVLESLTRVVPEIQPLVNWYFAEKIKIGPGSLSEIIESTRKALETLRQVCLVEVQLYEAENQNNPMLESAPVAP